MDKKIRVLIVDNETDFAESVSFWLESRGYDVKIASSSPDAVQLVKADPPDIVFLDLNMPVMDGIEALANIRKFNTELPVVMITAYAEEKKMDQARKLGASGFFPKKTKLEELGTIIQVTLKAHKKLQQEPEDKKAD